MSVTLKIVDSIVVQVKDEIFGYFQQKLGDDGANSLDEYRENMGRDLLVGEEYLWNLLAKIIETERIKDENIIFTFEEVERQNAIIQDADSYPLELKSSIAGLFSRLTL